jgi:hypothetical protein
MDYRVSELGQHRSVRLLACGPDIAQYWAMSTNTGMWQGMRLFRQWFLVVLSAMAMLAMAGLAEARSAADQAFYWEAWRVCNSNFYPSGTRPYINYEKHWFRCVEPWPRKQNGKRN